MATQTTNYGLVKPLQTESYDVDVFNGNMDILDSVIAALTNKLYPVGSIYITVDGTNPATKFGGTWVAVEAGLYLRAAGTDFAPSSTGGATFVTLATENLPAHSHDITVSSGGTHTHAGNTDEAGAHYHAVYGSNSGATGGDGLDTENDRKTVNSISYNTSTNGNHVHAFTTGSAGVHTHTATASNTGSNKAIDITNPYFTAYIWRRTA